MLALRSGDEDAAGTPNPKPRNLNDRLSGMKKVDPKPYALSRADARIIIAGTDWVCV